MHPGQHLPTHPQVWCTQVNTYLPIHRYSAHRSSALRSTPTYPLTGCLFIFFIFKNTVYQTRCENQVILASHGGLTTLWEQQLRKPKYDLCVPVTETLFTGIDNECISEGTRVPVFHDCGHGGRWGLLF